LVDFSLECEGFGVTHFNFCHWNTERLINYCNRLKRRIIAFVVMMAEE
jgi:hypothetical protein